MPIKKPVPSLESRVAGVFMGALIGVVGALSKTWGASINYFNALGRGFGVIGVLLGWIPGVLATVPGLAYGAWQGGKLGLYRGVKSILSKFDRLAQSFVSKARPFWNWNWQPLIPMSSTTAKPLPKSILKKPHDKNMGTHKTVKIATEEKQVRVYNPKKAIITIAPQRDKKKQERPRVFSALFPAYHLPSQFPKMDSILYRSNHKSNKTLTQLQEKVKQTKPQHAKHRRRGQTI